MGDKEKKNSEKKMKIVFGEFMPTAKVNEAAKHHNKIWELHVLLHEIIGHGSGTFDPEKYPEGDPVRGLGELGSALEEERADLTALVHAEDPKLVEIGFFKDQAEAKYIRNLSYDVYIADFLFRLARNGSFSEAHMRGHWLLINRALVEGSIQWASQDGKSPVTDENRVLKVVDYDKFHATTVDLLRQLQTIKATRALDEMNALFANEAPLAEIDKAWAQKIVERGQALKILKETSVLSRYRIDLDDVDGRATFVPIEEYFDGQNPLIEVLED
jgi:hypothetical protein